MKKHKIKLTKRQIEAILVVLDRVSDYQKSDYGKELDEVYGILDDELWGINKD